MIEPEEALRLAIEKATIDANELFQILLTKSETKDLWECALLTKELRHMDPGYIRFEVDASGARAIEVR